jgi:proton glutamate symport protein
MVFTLMLTSKGVAGVPRATLVVLLGTVDSFHLPSWPIFILLGVDQLMDMGRTMINVVGNCLATAVIAIWEGELGNRVTGSAGHPVIATSPSEPMPNRQAFGGPRISE